MKTLIYLAGLVAVGLAVAWFGFGVHRKPFIIKRSARFLRLPAVPVEHAGDVKIPASRFVDVIKNNYEDQDMTQPMAH